MTKQAALIISESGLQSLMTAGISTGWLKAWLLSAGAGDVVMHLLELDAWHDAAAEWQLFYGSEEELEAVAQYDGCSELSEMSPFTLDNPERHCRSYYRQGRQKVLLSLGDIACQRDRWLALFNDGKPMLPLYVRADDSLDIALEPGLSASLSKPADGRLLNTDGLLIEEQVIAALRRHDLSIRTVESCTAGSIIARLCRVPGASDVVDRGWVTYTNQAKQEEVGVDADLLEQHGAVSETVVRAMAEGGADASHICIAVSGIAGPGGGTDEKPVGTVWIAVAGGGLDVVTQCLQLCGARYEIQARTIISALSLLLCEMDYFSPL